MQPRISTSQVVQELAVRWGIRIDQPSLSEGAGTWSAPATRADGTAAFLKIGVPHMEAEQESDGLRFWAGDPTVRLLEADASLNALLLERCRPGTPLRAESPETQDRVIAELLPRMWRVPPPEYAFRHLSLMLDYWSDETRQAESKWQDRALVLAGLDMFEELSAPHSDDVLLATDLHAGNVLRSQRAPWLVIDPKPFVGDSAYDATQHLFNMMPRLFTNPRALAAQWADRLGVDRRRTQLWMFARAAAEPGAPADADLFQLARALAPS